MKPTSTSTGGTRVGLERWEGIGQILMTGASDSGLLLGDE